MQKLIEAYKVWHGFLPNIPKPTRYMFSAKIKSLFLELFELIFTASYSNKEQKSLLIQKANSKLDLLKFFLQTIWEVKSLDDKKYIAISQSLNEIGKMLGGWIKLLNK